MSCPGLSVRGKEGESVTPQERAAIQSFYYRLHARVEGGEFQERYEQEDIGRIIELLDETRRAALLEAMEKVKDRALLWRSHGGAKIAFPYDHLTVEGECDVIAAALDRLAQEG